MQKMRWSVWLEWMFLSDPVMMVIFFYWGMFVVLASSSVIPEEPTGANTTPMDDIQGVEFSTGDLIESQSPSLLVTEDIPKDIIEEPSGTNSSSAWEELQGTELAIQGSDVFRQQPVFINPPPPGVPPFPGAPPAPGIGKLLWHE